MLEESRFENVLKSFRVRRGKEWDQPKTAELLKIGLRTYKAWENGEYVPPHHQLQNIVATFRLSQEEEDTFYRAAAQVPPRMHTLPFPQNPFFTGREEHLGRLRQLLQNNESVAVTQPVSVSGLGGIGKTQVALEYAHQCYLEKVYRAVFWIDAADKTTIETSYIALARLLELPEQQDHETKRIVQAVKHWLEGHTNWLLIMDNADDLHLARSFFPAAHSGHILLTTRSQIIGNIARQIELAEMEPAEGVRFLLLRSRFVQEESEIDTVATDILKAAQQLVELLGGHPLALDQAGAYIEDTGISFAEYRKLFRGHRNSLMHRHGTLEGAHGEHPENVAVTIEMSFKRAAERQELAGDIMRFCAFLQPDAIPEELFQYDERFSTDQIAFNDAVTALLRHSLIRRDTQEQTVSVHRLVQAVLVDGMDSELQHQWRTRIAQALFEAFPSPEFSNRRQCERLLPQVNVCFGWKGDTFASTGGTLTMFHRMGNYLADIGWEVAEEVLQIVLDHYEQNYGPEDFWIVDIARDLACLYIRQHKPDQAIPLLQRALVLGEKHYGADRPVTAGILLNLATSYLQQDRYEQAWPPLIQAHSIFEKCYGADHLETATSLYTMGHVYDAYGSYEQAEALYLQALAILEKHLEADDPEFVPPLQRLALLFHRQGKQEQAAALFQRALSIYEQRYGAGATHPNVQAIKSSYASFLHTAGKHAEAEALETGDIPEPKG